MTYYRDRQGRPLELLEWASLFEDVSYQIVAQTELPNGVLVSTAWLGVEHPFGMFFETMVFGDGHDDRQWRYRTEAEAIAGHAEVVKEVSVEH